MRGVLKNEVIRALKRQQPALEDLADALMTIFYDKQQDPVVRNYAIQHLSSWYAKLAEKNKVLDALWAGTTDADPSTQGSALIALKSLAQPRTNMDKRRLGSVACGIARDGKASQVARATALQICAQLGNKEVLPTALALAHEPAGVPLRFSALAAIGALGGSQQVPLLKSLAAADDARIQTAARAALTRLQTNPKG